MAEKGKSRLANIVFVSIPEETAEKFEDFPLDPSILLPVEIPEGQPEWHINDLSWEMIIAAMLKIFAWQSDHKDIEYFRSFIEAVQPGIENEMSHTGITKAKNKDFEIAEEIFRALVNFNPDNVYHHLNLAAVLDEQAELYTKLGNSSLAEEYSLKSFRTYIDALKIHPDSPDILFNLGSFYIRKGNLEKARSVYLKFISLEKTGKRREFAEKILEKIPEDSADDMIFLEAYDLIRMEREDEGIRKIKRYLEDNPDVWNAWFMLGWAYRRKEQYEPAKEAFLKSLELEDSNIDTYNELAICLMELGEFKECRKYLLKALRKDGTNTKIISNLGVLALKENNTKDAEGFFKTVLEYDPDDHIAAKYLKFIKEKK